MKLSQEAKVGLLAVVALALFYFGFNFLKGSDLFSSTRQYEVIYDNVDGLTASNPVLINGLNVGRVKTIELLPNQNNALRVVVDIKKDIPVGAGSRAILADGGLLGGKIIRLEVNQRGAPLDNGGRLLADKETGITALVREKTLPVLNNVDSLVLQLNHIVAQFDQTGVVLNKTLRSADKAVGTLDVTIAENRAGLRNALANVNQLSRSLDRTTQQIDPVLRKASTFADSLNALQLRQTLNTVNRTVGNLQQMLADINRGEGTLGKLKSDEALYTNVNATTASLERLLTDLRENPKRYVHFSLFGRKEKKPDPATTKPGAVTVTTSTVTTTKVDTTAQPRE